MLLRNLVALCKSRITVSGTCGWSHLTQSLESSQMSALKCRAIAKCYLRNLKKGLKPKEASKKDQEGPKSSTGGPKKGTGVQPTRKRYSQETQILRQEDGNFG